MKVEQALPLLRYRNGERIDRFTVPTTVTGPIVAIDEETMTISKGRGASIALYLDGLESVLGGRDVMLHILIDAARHGDVVRVTLGSDALSFDNPAQFARLTLQS